MELQDEGVLLPGKPTTILDQEDCLIRTPELLELRAVALEQGARRVGIDSTHDDADRLTETG